MTPSDGGRYFDGTLGDGGHALAILESCSPSGELAGCDIDAAAVARAAERLEAFKDRARLFASSYTDIDRLCRDLGWEDLDGILVDLGMSSWDLADPERGFSFSQDGPLDMRYDRTQPLSAHDVINSYKIEDLKRVIREYGQERFASRIARRIVESRPVSSTLALAEIVSRAVPRGSWPSGIHPATKTFQAVRIEVNSELDNIRTFLPRAASLLATGGVLAVISFHSLEDRIVKRFMAGHSDDVLPGRRLPVPGKESTFGLLPITRKAITPGPEELEANPRARSARLRAARRMS